MTQKSLKFCREISGRTQKHNQRKTEKYPNDFTIHTKICRNTLRKPLRNLRRNLRKLLNKFQKIFKYPQMTQMRVCKTFKIHPEMKYK